LEFIKSWERFEPEIYPDQANKRTIGYGHKLLPGEAEKFQHGIDKNTAQRLLASDVSKAEATVRNLVKVPLTQRQYDSLVSLVYNIGSGNFAESTALKQLKDRNYRAAADAILLWNKVTKDGEKVTSDGLVNRRRAERNVFLDGK
jgi:lysozyme